MQFHSEDGLELLSRFNEQLRSFRSINLDEVLFAGDVNNKSVIEIVGGLSTGKTLLLYQFIAKCILPEQYDGIKINGHNVRAVLIDTLNHVRMSKMTELMTSVIRDTADAHVPADTISTIVNNSLKNLTVISCCNNEQLHLTLHMLEDEFLKDERIAVLAIDSILAYYWQERRKKILSMDQYARNLVRLILLRTSRFHIVTIYTRWSEPEREAHLKYRNPLRGTDVNYRLQLCKNTRTREFVANVQSAKDVKQIRYTISNSRITWILG